MKEKRETTINVNGVIVIICLFIIGFFGTLWTYNLSEHEININMDDNTLNAVKSLNETVASVEMLNRNIHDITTYDINDCQFITDRQEFWCIK